MKMEEEALFVFPTDDSIQYLGNLKSDASQKDIKLPTEIHQSGVVNQVGNFISF